MNRRIFGLKNQGVRIDGQTGQSVVTAKHTGDIIYDLVGETAISKKSEYITPSRERILNPSLGVNLNEVGEDKNYIKRTAKKRYVRL